MSYVERANLSIRMGNRRFTRLTNGFSKKLENHCHMLAVSFMLIDAHHEAILAAQFEKAKTYAPVAPKLPWYLDPNGTDPTLEKP